MSLGYFTLVNGTRQKRSRHLFTSCEWMSASLLTVNSYTFNKKILMNSGRDT